MAIILPTGSGTLRQQLLMMHGIAWNCSMILNGNIFQTAPSSEFRTGSSLEKYVLCQLTNSELDLVWNSELGSVWNLYFFI